jgi:glycosyltransferase involved in cell wall biosynthesis
MAAIAHGRRLISVLVPAYNHAAYIADTIGSVLAQDWPDIELIVLDDGSTDGTLAVAERTLAGERRLRVRLEQQANAGISETQNRLIAMADGDVLAILNSDDRYRPRRLSAIMEHAAGAARFFAFSGIEVFDSDGADDAPLLLAYYHEARAKAAALPTLGFGLLLANITVSSSNFVFSRDLAALSGGFDPAFPMSQDWDFVLRCLHTVEPILVPQTLLAYRMHPGNTWRRYQETRIGEAEAVLRNYFAWRGANENPLAPSAATWPRFFPIFAAVAGPGFARENFATMLRRWNITADRPRRVAAADAATESAAIARLVEACRAPA